MGFFSRLFGTNRLARQLASNDDATFVEGLTEAVRLVDSGDIRGVEAMREAIRSRSRSKCIRFYEPGLVTGTSERYEQARQKIVSLARERALLRDAYASGDQISAFVQFSDLEDLSSLFREICAVGGPSEGYAFQLLFNECRGTAMFSEDR